MNKEIYKLAEIPAPDENERPVFNPHFSVRRSTAH